MSNSLQTAHETSLVEAGVYFKIEGKTATEKRVNAIKEANHYGVAMYAMTSKTKAVREVATAQVGAASLAAVVRAKMSGNWKPAAGLFAFILGETVKFGMGADGAVLTGDDLRKRLKSDWARLQVRIEDALESTEQTTKAGKVSPKWARWDEARQVFEAIEKLEAAELERRTAVRNEREARAQDQE